MKENIKRLYGKKGVTLVELIVVMAITTIMFGIALGMLQPVTALIASLKGNANMDTISDIANDYIRNCMEKSVAVSAVSYHDLDAVKDTWKAYTDKYTTDKGYSVRALGVMQNYNGDSRLYDFGEVNVINCKWGATFELHSADDGSAPGTAFVTMIRDRDGGGREGKGGLNGNEFHKFDAFNDAFYSNGTEGTTNYSFEVAFEIESKEIGDGSTSVSGVSRVTLCSQIFKRTGSWGSFEFEPVNQARTLSFNLLNGTAKLDISQNVNSVETAADGSKTIKVATDAGGGRDGLVILYAVRKIDIDKLISGSYDPSKPSDDPTPTPTPTPDPDVTTDPADEPAPDITTTPDDEPGGDEDSVTATATLNGSSNSYFIELDNLIITNNGSTNISLSDITITVTGNVITGVERVFKTSTGISVSNANSISLSGLLAAGDSTTISQVYYGHPSWAQVFESGTQATISVYYKGTLLLSETINA